jgi:hypothetical protein
MLAEASPFWNRRMRLLATDVTSRRDLVKHDLLPNRTASDALPIAALLRDKAKDNRFTIITRQRRH